jgi:hypothetical protein
MTATALVPAGTPDHAGARDVFASAECSSGFGGSAVSVRLVTTHIAGSGCANVDTATPIDSAAV